MSFTKESKDALYKLLTDTYDKNYLSKVQSYINKYSTRVPNDIYKALTEFVGNLTAYKFEFPDATILNEFYIPAELKRRFLCFLSFPDA